MKRLLLIRPEAEQDLAEARDWYEGKRVGLGDEFLDEVALAMRGLEQDSELPRLYFLDFRRVLLRRFPYKIFYQVIGERLVVFRILHAKQEHGRGLNEPPAG
jgi:plasmid stabilization system protein ParE